MRASQTLIDTFRCAARTPYTHRRLRRAGKQDPSRPMAPERRSTSVRGGGGGPDSNFQARVSQVYLGLRVWARVRPDQHAKGVRNLSPGPGALRRPKRYVPATRLREDGVVHEVVYAAERLRIHALVLFQPHASCKRTARAAQAGRSHRCARNSTRAKAPPTSCRQVGEGETMHPHRAGNADGTDVRCEAKKTR
jgi:hypothetical protein